MSILNKAFVNYSYKKKQEGNNFESIHCRQFKRIEKVLNFLLSLAYYQFRY